MGELCENPRTLAPSILKDIELKAPMIDFGYMLELAVAGFLAYRIWDLIRRTRARIRDDSVIRGPLIFLAIRYGSGRVFFPSAARGASASS